jgi:hypothetical protein
MAVSDQRNIFEIKMKKPEDAKGFHSQYKKIFEK